MKRVITYGTFDLLHYGHINLLKRAKALGDYLIVVISTDEFNWNEKHKRCYFTYEQRKEKLGNKFVVLFRAHYEVAKHMNVDGYSMFLDMSSYPDLNELMIVADALISDYSSIYFDFSVTHKPMYCYAYDYDRYMSNRGMYLNLKDELPCVIHQDEDDLILLQISQ